MKYTVEINFKDGMLSAMLRKFDNLKDAKKCAQKYLNVMLTEDNDIVGIIKVSLHAEIEH